MDVCVRWEKVQLMRSNGNSFITFIRLTQQKKFLIDSRALETEKSVYICHSSSVLDVINVNFCLVDGDCSTTHLTAFSERWPHINPHKSTFSNASWQGKVFFVIILTWTGRCRVYRSKNVMMLKMALIVHMLPSRMGKHRQSISAYPWYC